MVLFVFLFNLRTALISLLAIPLSLLTAIVMLWAWGISLNTLTLGGLAIAVGEVVNDAIIDVENIDHRLRQNSRLGRPRTAAAVVLSASLEVRSAVVYATFIVVLVFVPIFFLSGLQGRLFSPLGYAYALAVTASLIVALTVTPALSLLLLPRARGALEPPLLRRLHGVYEPCPPPGRRAAAGRYVAPHPGLHGRLGTVRFRRRIPAGNAREPLRLAHARHTGHLRRPSQWRPVTLSRRH